jgi:hypothetical protein
VLAVSGELSLRSSGLVSGAVAKALADSGRVLVDVSGLRVTWPLAVQVFPSVLVGLGGWPGARLMLFGADAGLARSLAALRVSATVPVALDEATAPAPGPAPTGRRPVPRPGTAAIVGAWCAHLRAGRLRRLAA